MAANRYGQIWHGDHHHINIRFPSNEARLKFQSEFEAYHASHDHDGPVPVFKCVTTKDLKLSTGSRSPEDLVKAETDKDYRITIDGYSWSDIHSYHNPSGLSDYSWYRVPTCCVPPTIVIDREFVDSGTLKRHELSALFTDMSDDDFKKLCASIEANGFIEPVIRIYEGKILDGWHRYRAAKELNLIRKLKFQEWDERDEGDPVAFVLARNIERRHLTPGQRAQIVVEASLWLEKGDVDSQRDGGTNDAPRSRQEMADQANASIKTIDRAKQVSETGRAKEVISGEKTAGEVLEEQKAKADAEREAAIEAVKPRFDMAVSAWHTSQTDRLWKFEKLPVGRTPLIDSEYIKTYFELADPRIPQNTKPTAAHYEGAIECMLDHADRFAKQLEGRHYRRIIKDWDESVLPQLICRFQGPLLGYQASQLKADAFEVRIRQAIREQYGFQGRIPSQPFEVLFEITEDAHAVLIQLNPKEWVRNGREISWAMSVLPAPIETPAAKERGSREKPAAKVVSEETLKRLWEQITAEMQEWKQRHTGVIYATKSVLLDAYREQKESDRKGPATVAELTGILKVMDEDCRAYALRVRYLRSDLRDAYETAQTEYFKARADLTAFVNEKEIPLSDFIEATKTQYHRTNVAEMFGQPSDIRKDSMLTTGVFEDWTGFMRVLYVDVKARAAWVPIPKEVDAQDEGQTEQDPFHDVDLADVKANLQALLKKVMPAEKHPLYHQICEDIHDAYLDYENLPNDREIFAILLDCALTAIEELEG